MQKALSKILGVTFISVLCLPAYAGDLCDTVRAIETSNVKLFSQAVTKYSGIFAKGDCKPASTDVVCRRDYTKAGAIELFGSTSGMVVAGIVGGSFEQCGYVQHSDEVQNADDPPGDRLYVATYQIPADVSDDGIIDRFLRIVVRAKKKSQGIRITFIAANISDD